MFRNLLIGGLTLVGIALPHSAKAQVTVQQPSIHDFSVGTTVSAPDRGRSTAGGVRRGGASRSKYGPFPSGTSTGAFNEGTSVDAHVRIHDFDELDRQALGAAGQRGRSSDRGTLSPRAELAFRNLQNRPALTAAANRADGTAVPAGSGTRDAPAERNTQSGPSSRRLCELGRKAAADGKQALALSYFRVARDRGSVDAEKEIEQLEGRRSGARAGNR